MYRVAVVSLAMCACVGSMVRAPRTIPSDGVVECTDSMELPATAAVIGAVALSAALFAVTTDPKGTMDAGGIFWLPVLGGAGATALFGAAEGAAHARECRDAKRRGAEIAAAAQRRNDEARDEAIVRYKRAADAGRFGDCAIVRTLDAEVRELDVDFHDSVFVRDVAIVRCLDEREDLVKAAVDTP